MSTADSTTAWVTVSGAAEKAGVESGTIRQWYRSGRIPTRRSEGEKGAFLVPLDLVLELARPDAAGPAPAPAAAASRQAPDAEAIRELEFLRGQLAELSEENRRLQQQLRLSDDARANLRAELADLQDERTALHNRMASLEHDLVQLRRVAARSSITDHSWLDENTPAYEGPSRRQGAPAVPPGAGTQAVPPSRELSDLLAATRPDGESSYGEVRPAVGPSVGPHTLDDQDEVAFVAPRPVPSESRADYGTSADDFLPEPPKKGRFGKK
jgi:hypothetical protein